MSFISNTLGLGTTVLAATLSFAPASAGASEEGHEKPPPCISVYDRSTKKTTVYCPPKQ